MNLEHSSIEFGTTRIEYQIRRSARRKTVGIAVEPTGEVVVTAPPQAALARLDTLVRSKAAWVLKHRRTLIALEPAVPARKFESGESYLYLGRQYRLLVREGHVPRVTLKAQAGRLLAVVPVGLSLERRPVAIRVALIAWYRRHALEWLTARTAIWSTKVELPLPQLLIREQEKRWGSCDAVGCLRFNWRIIQTPLRLIDYVVAHESVHRLHPDHTDRFWSTLASLMPDYEARREALRVLGPRLDW